MNYPGNQNPPTVATRTVWANVYESVDDGVWGDFFETEEAATNDEHAYMARNIAVRVELPGNAVAARLAA